MCNFFYSDHSEFPSASSSTASSTILSDLGSSENETSTSYSIPPSPKQPCIEPEPEVSVVNIDIADLAKRRSSLTEHEKYHFYCHRFTPDINYKFSGRGGRAFQHRYMWLSYSQKENGGLLSLHLLC